MAEYHYYLVENSYLVRANINPLIRHSCAVSAVVYLDTSLIFLMLLRNAG